MPRRTDQEAHGRDQREDQRFTIGRALMDLELAKLKAKQLRDRNKNDLTTSVVELIEETIKRLEKIY